MADALNWTPPALAQLDAEATARSSFSLDRTTLALAAGFMPSSEPEARQAISKLDGVSVHVLRFGAIGIVDQPAVNEVRAAYRMPGWKHVIGRGAIRNANAYEPSRNEITDLWVSMDGANVREIVALIESPASLTLVTVTGNISPIDLLRLRGHFGIPRFDGDSLLNMRDR